MEAPKSSNNVQVEHKNAETKQRVFYADWNIFLVHLVI
jgi:hypothetical protein